VVNVFGYLGDGWLRVDDLFVLHQLVVRCLVCGSNTSLEQSLSFTRNISLTLHLLTLLRNLNKLLLTVTTFIHVSVELLISHLSIHRHSIRVTVLLHLSNTCRVMVHFPSSFRQELLRVFLRFNLQVLFKCVLTNSEVGSDLLHCLRLKVYVLPFIFNIFPRIHCVDDLNVVFACFEGRWTQTVLLLTCVC